MFKTKLTVAALTTIAAAQAGAWDIKVGNDKTVAVHGFASQGFLATSKYNYLADTEDGGSAQFTELGLNVSYSPFERTRIAVQGFAFDVGNVGNFEPLLDYASVEYMFNNYVGVRGGRVRKPGGIYNHIQDLDLARTSVLLPQGIYDARWRDFTTSLDGGAVFGTIPMGKAGSLSYEAFAGMMNLSMQGGVANLLRNSVTRLDALDSFVDAGVQLWWNTPITGLRAGFNLAKAYDFTYDFGVATPLGLLPAHSQSDALVQQYSLEYLVGKWTFQAEYYSLDLNGSTVISSPFGPMISQSNTHQDSWYVSAAYRVNKWMEVGTYYTEFYADQTDRSSSPDKYQKDVALSFRFDPKDWWIVKLEGHYIHGTALLRDDGANPPPHNDDGYFMFAAKTTFSF